MLSCFTIPTDCSLHQSWGGRVYQCRAAVGCLVGRGKFPLLFLLGSGSPLKQVVNYWVIYRHKRGLEEKIVYLCWALHSEEWRPPRMSCCDWPWYSGNSRHSPTWEWSAESWCRWSGREPSTSPRVPSLAPPGSRWPCWGDTWPRPPRSTGAASRRLLKYSDNFPSVRRTNDWPVQT